MTFLVLFISILLQTLLTRACEQGWYAYKQEKCLLYDPVNVNFEKAVNLCSDKNATLASIGSKEEQDFILALGRLHYTLSGVHWVWLGLVRNASNPNQFHWKDGSTFNYTNWREGCPDTRQGENCVLMTVFRDRPSHWCNFRCDSNFDHVICQKEYTEGESTQLISTTSFPPTRRYPNRFRPRRPWFPVISESDECDFGWDFKFNKCYKFITQNITGEEARYYCQRFGEGAQPLTIISETEQSWAVDFAFFKNEAKEAMWLGAVRVGPENNSIKWRDGRDMNYTNWSPHEPDNRNKGENCVAMNDMPKFFGMWLDAPCTLKFHLICEKPAKIPLPANYSDNVIDDVISGKVDSLKTLEEPDEVIAGSSSKLVGFLMFVIVVLSISTAFLGYTVFNQKKEMGRNIRESRVNIYYASEEPEYEEPKYTTGSFQSEGPYSSTTSSIAYASCRPAQEESTSARY
jgi:hypothetical protein